MNTKTLKLSAVLALALAGWCGAAAAAGTADPAAMVAKLDALRRPSAANLKMGFTLTTTENDAQDTYRYTGLIRRDAGTLVLAEDGDQRGQKYLYTPGGYWLYAPRTRRPMRLTPLQTLRGQASIGDISRLNLADDYSAAFAAQGEAKVDDQECYVLTLTAKSPEASYASITLYVAKADQAPVQADLLAATGRKLKTLKFGGLKKVGGQNLLTTLTYIDAVNPNKRTVQQIHAVEASSTPAAMFQPQALALEN
ncbi:outer membrane lipoprotein-sorting protein [Pseudoduganella ginsengisoli]|uniref:Outer membrane lipoprotein-sorting protein n=1 Tax=Pseudoduganella ginsengisoli TaxID=1462440 RepID=A0A6L6Q2N9_9BURK|nr:outer membrane lipoprotein-sorting protein [Pseudoduganella ginsengisoli]MTW03508.1 outer membrane lipoprotein-sorting protein [Pseudoduganella ginsengisoli]